MNFARLRFEKTNDQEQTGRVPRALALSAIVGLVSASTLHLTGCSGSQPCETAFTTDGQVVTVRSPENNNKAVFVSADELSEQRLRLTVMSSPIVGKTLATQVYEKEEVVDSPTLTYAWNEKTELNITVEDNGETVRTYCVVAEPAQG